jgi:hypothetical protein
MNKMTITAIAAAVGLAFGTFVAAADMSKPDYAAAKERIKSEHRTAKAACDPLKGNAQDVCVAEAKGRQSVALAELSASYEPTRKHRDEARMAKVQADYSVAKEKCDDQAGNAKDVCLKEAAAAQTAAKADLKAQRKVADARKDASADKNTAEYRVAKEKCDALAGDAKEACVQDAKARYGKS